MRLFAGIAVAAAVMALGTGAVASPPMSDSEMPNEEMMMILMGGGIEAEPGLSASAAGVVSASVLSAGPARAAGFRSIDVRGALATRAFGINARGEIVGSYTDSTGTTYGYLWREGDVTTITVPGAIHTEAWGINPRGDIVGRYRRSGDARTFGFLLRDGVFTDISVAGHLHTLPIKITPSGVIVGCFHDTNFLQDMRGYVQRGDTVRSFELLPSTMHNGVARSGRLIAGISFDSATQVHGYVLNRRKYTQFDFPGATFTQAWDISPSGTAVGYFNPVESHGFSLDDGRFTQIDVPGASWTRIFGINPEEDMVGMYADASNRVHGFLLNADHDGDDKDDEED